MMQTQSGAHPGPPSGSHALRWRRAAPLDLYKLGCGLFLLVAPWLFGFVSRSGRLDTELTGLALTALAIAAIVLFAEWEEWLQLALGLWLIAAPWALGLAHTSFMHVSVTIGVIVTYLAALELWMVRSPETFD
ncbi:MAG: SPW repeat protein [Xanthobacteraceae bacterium]|nr:SPW repeat protein [Xanthobacteraceae bacterium]